MDLFNQNLIHSWQPSQSPRQRVKACTYLIRLILLSAPRTADQALGPSCIMSTAFSYQDCTAEVDEYLSSVSVSDDEPALALHWEQNALSQFVDAANSVDDSVDMPDWLTQPRGSITADSIVEDMMAFLATKAGGRFGRVLLAPNSVVQFGQLCGMFAYIENDAFVRAAAAGMSDGATLAKVFCLTKGSASAAVPMEFPPRENQSRRLFS
ncbi:hypothetical protein F441_11565 [Phytophthora nicotianae CJ01A1]|uniref:Uncharacterized protein n=2 Tax=Phytophthora nicotianae TaxID=4792 RepID=W2WUF8_PHYNI|nr:hypothetical protein F444_11719 [Phytophthora nicotianae P1976]ETP13194.1 hypothetical protein F441_11565 [Phytophthora nicotianae CJ01A1]